MIAFFAQSQITTDGMLNDSACRAWYGTILELQACESQLYLNELIGDQVIIINGDCDSLYLEAKSCNEFSDSLLMKNIQLNEKYIKAKKQRNYTGIVCAVLLFFAIVI